MPITSVTRDNEAFTMTVIADFKVAIERLWDAYTDPRQIEKFWGPVEFPATFLRHDCFPGGLSNYRMVGPKGEVSCGYWEWLTIREHELFKVLDGFAHEDGTPDRDMPSVRVTFEFSDADSGSRLTITTHFPDLEALDELLAMGMEEGMRSAMSQIDAVLADSDSRAATQPTELQLLGDTQARITRVIKAPIGLVWRANIDPESLQQWLLGPDGWSMPVCEMSAEAGFTYRYEWQNDETSERFGFTGEVVEVIAPHRLVTSERAISTEKSDGDESPETLNELTFTPCEGGTRLTYVITYPSTELRDEILATGMVDGMEFGFARLDRQLNQD